MDSEAKAINYYLDVETRYMPAAGFYTDSGNAQIRSQAVSIIATHSPTISPDAFIPYLAMNYFDRYFSTNQFQDVQDVKSDSEKVCFIALCCLFIAAQMRIDTFSFDGFPRIKYENFTHERIKDMELNILNVLQWRIPVTPFAYLNYYYRLFKTLGSFKRRWINEIIVQAQGENEFVCYKPSQIAMSAFLVAAKIAYPSEYNKHHYKEAEGELSECVRALLDLCGKKNIKIEPPHDGQITTLTDEIGNKTHLEEGLLEAGTTKGEAKKLAHDEVIAILTDEIGEGWKPRKARIVKETKKPSHAEIIAILADEVGNKIDLEEGSLERKQKAILDEIVEIDEEEEQRLAKGKAVAEASNEENRRLAKGKAVVEASDEENRRLAKGKMVAVSEILDEERQRQAPKLISEEEQEKIDRLEATIKLAMEKGKLEKGVQDGRSLGEIISELKPMNFDLKWPAYIPS